MKIYSLVLAALFSTHLAAEDALTLRQVVTNTDRVGSHVLVEGYRGRFTKHFNEGGREIISNSKSLEFTHANFPTLGHLGISEEDLPINEIVIGVEHAGSNEGFAYRASTVAVKHLPSFDELTKLKEIADYKNLFGKFRGITDGWGMPGEWHSSLGWMGFSLLDDGKIRVVTVFLHTENKGDGWRISSRNIKEGLFHPTGTSPVLEKAEPSDAPEPE